MLPTACFLPSSLPPRSPGSQRATCHTYLFAHRGSQVAHMWADGGQTDSPQVLSLLSEIDTIYSFLFSPKSFLPAGGKCLAQSCTSPARTCHENSGKCSISMIGNPSALWPRRPPVSPPPTPASSVTDLFWHCVNRPGTATVLWKAVDFHLGWAQHVAQWTDRHLLP